MDRSRSARPTVKRASAFWESRFDLRFDDKTLTLAAQPGVQGAPASHNGITINTNGNVGIGMESLLPDSQWKLKINGPTRLNAGGSAGAIEFSTPNGETGMSILSDFDRADVRFDGSTLKLVAGSGLAAPPEKNGLAITTSGRVGIGTAAPATTLHVETTQPGTAVYGNALGPSGIGVVGSAGAGNIGVYARNTAGGTAVHAEGNATQSLDKSGFVKAMAYIDGSGNLIRCYNSQKANNEITTAPCGIRCDRIQNGFNPQYVVYFGFSIKDRFVLVTPRTVNDERAFHKSAGIEYASDDSAIVSIWSPDDADYHLALDEFTIVVF